MLTTFVEAETDWNWGKFLVAQWEPHDWNYISPVSGTPLLSMRRHRSELLVVDLQTGEGACFVPNGLVQADLQKHQIWVCVLYEAFLEWLYEQVDAAKGHGVFRVTDLPSRVKLNVPPSLYGHRRPGPEQQERDSVKAACKKP